MGSRSQFRGISQEGGGSCFNDLDLDPDIIQDSPVLQRLAAATFPTCPIEDSQPAQLSDPAQGLGYAQFGGLASEREGGHPAIMWV